MLHNPYMIISLEKVPIGKVSKSLAWFTFSSEYQKGCDNVATDASSHVTSKLDADPVKSNLDGVTVGTTGRADSHDLVVVQADE